jgi:hypothetical protein
LQNSGLIVGAAGTQTILRSVAAERRDRLGSARRVNRHRKRASAGYCSDEMAAIDVHGRSIPASIWPVFAIS